MTWKYRRVCFPLCILLLLLFSGCSKQEQRQQGQEKEAQEEVREQTLIPEENVAEESILSRQEPLQTESPETQQEPYMKKIFTEYIADGTIRYSREENPALYENAEKLLEMRYTLIMELLSSGASYVDLEQELVTERGDKEDIYYLLDWEGITGWDYYEKRAEEIYCREYVDNVFHRGIWKGNHRYLQNRMGAFTGIMRTAVIFQLHRIPLRFPDIMTIVISS